MSAVALLPHPALESSAATLNGHITAVANGLTPSESGLVLDGTMKVSFQDALDALHASEGTIWFLDPGKEALVPVFNTGPQAESFVLKHHQPLNRGIVSSVFLSQTGIAERDVYKNSTHDAAANQKMGVVTCAMIAVPFFFSGRARGVLSAVKLKPAGAPEKDDPPPFNADALARFNHFASLLGAAVDGRLLKSAFGL